eukprot:GEMP01088157.1.p1 GENE.GEMP01088157.1~~GEMP01088157.1.p1  ORF type:complete len:246 (+),score=35.07 GEMP01088157.1:213-950(+)
MPLACSVLHREGASGKFNYLFHRIVGSSRVVCLFPGDISDFASPGTEYKHSLEGIFWRMCRKFPNDDVLMIRPKIIKDHFALYLNFLVTDPFGIPRPEAALDVDSALHFEKLLQATGEEYEDVCVVGFSKGLVVLNSLLSNPGKCTFWSRVSAFHYVDPGLHQPGAFPRFSVEDLQAVAPSLRISIHGTPRQFQDPSRPFVREEATAFHTWMQKAGVDCRMYEYFQDQSPSLDMHFNALDEFKIE